MPTLSCEIYDFFPVLPWMEIRGREPMTGDLTNGGWSRRYLVRAAGNEGGTCSCFFEAAGTRTDRTDGGAAEVNLWTRWTIADTTAAFNSTLSTSRNDPARDRRDELFLEQRDMRWPRPVPRTPARERKSYGCGNAVEACTCSLSRENFTCYLDDILFGQY